jgi:hypothetical protein
MARAPRIQFEDALYHICARGNRRESIYRCDKDYSRFEELENVRLNIYSALL